MDSKDSLVLIKTTLGWFVGKTRLSNFRHENREIKWSGNSIQPPLILHDPAQIDIFSVSVPRQIGGTQIAGVTSIHILPVASITLHTEGPFIITDVLDSDPLFNQYQTTLAEYNKKRDGVYGNK